MRGKLLCKTKTKILQRLNLLSPQQQYTRIFSVLLICLKEKNTNDFILIDIMKY